MMNNRKRIVLLVSVWIAVAAYAGQYEIRSEKFGPNDLYGIFNTESQTWEVPCTMRRIEDIGFYRGVRYYAMLNYAGYYAVVSENNLHFRKHLYERVRVQRNLFAQKAAFYVRKNGKWGVATVGNEEIVPCTYASLENVVGVYPSKTAAPVASADINIVSPLNNTEYTEPFVSVGFTTSLAQDKVRDHVRFAVNGQEVEPKWAEDEKGVRPATKNEQVVVIPLPYTKETCRISASVETADGKVHEDHITLQYAGSITKPTLHVFAVGINDYQAPDIKNLRFAVKDAQEFMNTVKNTKIESLYDHMDSIIVPQEKANTEYIIQMLQQLRKQVNSEDVVILYFSGHGMKDQKDDKAYFLTMDASANRPQDGLPFDVIMENCSYMANDNECKILILMDACYSGAMTEEKKSALNAEMATHPAIVGLYSSSEIQPSSETSTAQHGLFTKALIEGINNPQKAFNADDGSIMINQLFGYIAKQVSSQTKNRQTPILDNSRCGYLIILKQ